MVKSTSFAYHKILNLNAGRKLAIRFSDTGPGIPSENREKVFAPYYSTRATGFGLGLAITRKIIEEHGGRVYVDEPERSGADMVVELPFAVKGVAPAETKPPTAVVQG